MKIIFYVTSLYFFVQTLAEIIQLCESSNNYGFGQHKVMSSDIFFKRVKIY